jgi:hypothetical protein
MAELKWLDEYSGQSTKALLALEGKYQTESLVLAFDQALQQKADNVGYADLTDEERVVLAVEAVEREVNNGGFMQLFMNSSKELAPIFVDSLKRIGCKEAANLTQEAIDIMEVEGESDEGDFDEEMDDGEENESRDDRLSDCDERYCDVADELTGRLFEFIKKNRDKITLDD